jgi:hypothetical protein
VFVSRSIVRLLGIVVATGLVVTSCSSDDDVDSAPSTAAVADTSVPASTSPATPEPSGEFDPYAQTLEWSECEEGECAEVTVPIDYDDPSAGTTTIAMVRQPTQGIRVPGSARCSSIRAARTSRASTSW